MTACDISVVIPVYRSSDCLEALLKEISRVLDGLGRPYEVILVDDSSPDESWSVIQSLAHRYPVLRAFQLMRNAGQAKATLCGLEHARGAITLTMDDDLQHPPNQIPRLLAALEEHPDVDCVLGYFTQKKHAGYRNVASRIIRAINIRAFDAPRDIRFSTFRAMRRSTVEAIIAHQTVNPAISVLLFNATRRVISLPVEHAERYAGQSTYSLRKQFRLALDNICNATMLPLRAVSALGLITCAMSLLLLFFYLLRFMLGYVNYPGWITVVLLLVFFSGMILLSLGVMGEYLVRIIREVRGYPRYFIRETCGDAPAEPPTTNHRQI